jgi:D-inositol-3-phosphate glycosyltransferase
MKVLVVSSYLLPHCGGVEVLVDQEIQLLARQGHSVVVIGSNAGEGESPIYGADVEVIRIAAWNGLEQRFQVPWLVFSPRLAPLLLRYIRWCDVVHVHGFLSVGSLVALIFARYLNKRSILTEHIGLAWYSSRLKWLVQWLAIWLIGIFCVRMAKRSFAYHERVVALLQKLAGPRGQIYYLPNPLQRSFLRPPNEQERLDARQALGWPKDRPTVLFVGRLVIRKGIDLLLQAKNSEFDLVFCGPGDSTLLGDLQNKGITYLQPRSRRELVSLYHAADVLAVPSRSEGGLVLVAQEALLCGLPVLVGDDPGLTRYRSCAGLHFCALKPEAIQRGISMILRRHGRTFERQGELLPLERFLPDEGEWVKQLLR